MQIIADCGSSKTDWILGNHVSEVTTLGYNPNYGDGESFINSVQRKLADWPLDSADLTVHFYGSGQFDVEGNMTQQLLRVVFPKATFNIQHDLMGACRACAGSEAGIVAILGTGSNSCVYDGKNIVDQIPSLGFSLGDEGSGNYIGKLFLRAYAYRTMPEHMKGIVEAAYPGKIHEIKKQFFASNQPSVFLANFGALFREKMSDTFAQGIVQTAFQHFTQDHLVKYSKYKYTKVHFVGSVAYYHSTLLGEELAKVGLELGNIIRRPIDGLVDYHLKAI